MKIFGFKEGTIRVKAKYVRSLSRIPTLVHLPGNQKGNTRIVIQDSELDDVLSTDGGGWYYQIQTSMPGATLQTYGPYGTEEIAIENFNEDFATFQELYGVKRVLQPYLLNN